MKKLKNVKLALIEKDLTQKELARMAGIEKSVLSNTIAGRWVLRQDQQEKVALILNKTVQELFS